MESDDLLSSTKPFEQFYLVNVCFLDDWIHVFDIDLFESVDLKIFTQHLKNLHMILCAVHSYR